MTFVQASSDPKYRSSPICFEAGEKFADLIIVAGRYAAKAAAHQSGKSDDNRPDGSNECGALGSPLSGTDGMAGLLAVQGTIGSADRFAIFARGIAG